MPDLPLNPDRSKDWLLVSRILGGDEAAVNELLSNHCAPLFPYLIRSYFQPGEYSAIELKHDTFVHLRQNDWRVLRTYGGKSSLKTWMQAVVTNICLHRLKEIGRFRYLQELEEEFLPAIAPPGGDVQEQLWAVEKALPLLKSLHEQQVIRLLMRRMEIVEIAEALKITRKHADVLKHRAILNLKKIFEKGGLS